MEKKHNPLRWWGRRLGVLLLLGAPLFWAVFTKDGQRWTDIYLMKARGNPEMAITFDALTPELTLPQIRTALPDLKIACASQATPYGDQACHAPIAAFNGIPAHYIVFFLQGDQLRAVKIAYRRTYHDWMLPQLKERLGKPEESEQDVAAGIYRWHVGKGVVVALRERQARGQEPVLLWLAMTGASPILD